MYYYNPKIYNPAPVLYNISKIPSHKYEMYTKITKGPFAPYADRDKALNSRWTGICRFWENGELYSANHIAINAFKPVPSGEVQTHFGINWDTYYADDKETLMKYLAQRYETVFGAEPTYDETIGLWSIQIHYDGRCR